MKNDKKQTRTHIDNESLEKVAKGTILVFIGILASSLLIFFGRLIIIRQWTQDEYGIFSLAFTALMICALISTLGLGPGVIRNIAYSRGKKDNKKILDMISASIFFSIAASIITGLILFLLSETIAEVIFHETSLTIPLRIFSVAVPFYTIIDTLVSIYRGFDQIKPAVYFKYIVVNMLFPVFLVATIVLNLSFINVFYAYLVSLILTLTIFIIYILRQISPLKLLSVK